MGVIIKLVEAVHYNITLFFIVADMLHNIPDLKVLLDEDLTHHS